jgi:hypothetical protein
MTLQQKLYTPIWSAASEFEFRGQHNRKGTRRSKGTSQKSSTKERKNLYGNLNDAK